MYFAVELVCNNCRRSWDCDLTRVFKLPRRLHKNPQSNPLSINSLLSLISSLIRRLSSFASFVNIPCLRAFWFPSGAPEPLAPPCMRQRFFPDTAGDLQGVPARVFAPQRKLVCIDVVWRLWVPATPSNSRTRVQNGYWMVLCQLALRCHPSVFDRLVLKRLPLR